MEIKIRLPKKRRINESEVLLDREFYVELVEMLDEIFDTCIKIDNQADLIRNLPDYNAERVNRIKKLVEHNKFILDYLLTRLPDGKDEAPDKVATDVFYLIKEGK